MYQIFVFLALSFGYFSVVPGQDPEEPMQPMVPTSRGYTPIARRQEYHPAEPPNSYWKAEPPNSYRKAESPRGFGPQSTNGDMSANQVKRQRAPGQRPPTRRMTPRSAMTAYCSMSESDPAVDGDRMKERLMAYISCKESTMVSINSGHIFPQTGQAIFSHYSTRSHSRPLI